MFRYLGSSVIDHFFGGQVALVADEQLVDTLAGITINFLQPLLDVVERFLVGAIVNDNDPVGPSVVA